MPGPIFSSGESTGKEDKSNKKTDLSSTNAAHYPNVVAVKGGLDNMFTEVTNYDYAQALSNELNF